MRTILVGAVLLLSGCASSGLSSLGLGGAQSYGYPALGQSALAPAAPTLPPAPGTTSAAVPVPAAPNPSRAAVSVPAAATPSYPSVPSLASTGPAEPIYDEKRDPNVMSVLKMASDVPSDEILVNPDGTMKPLPALKPIPVIEIEGGRTALRAVER